MSSQQYSEKRTFQSETHRGTDGYTLPINSGVSVPINYSSDKTNEQRVQERIRQRETTVQWITDSVSGAEKFRVTVNIDGFRQNEVNIHVEGNKLVVYGEHNVNENHSTAKKIIEKSYELPRDIDIHSPQVTYPTPITMQIDFPSRHSNVIIDDGRLSNKLISNNDTSYRTSPRFSREKTSSEFTSTRKIGGGSATTGYEQSSNPRTFSSYDRLFDSSNTARDYTYSSNTQYKSRENQSPSRRVYNDSKVNSLNNSNDPTYTYRVTRDDTQPRTLFPSTSRNDNNTNVIEKTYTETHSETHHRRSSPTTGVQSSHEVEHHRSGSPSIARNLDENQFRTSLHINERGISPQRTTRNVEVREYSRRIGGANGTIGDSSFIRSSPSLFTQGFNSDAFYRSAFQPQVFTDDRGQNRIEMKLDVQNYEPHEIKISVIGNDLIVQAEHNVERPPTSSTRAYLYKQITLPPNTDFKSVSSDHYTDGKLYITAKLFNEKAPIGYN